MVVEEEEADEGGKVLGCCGGRRADVEAVMDLGGNLAGALLRCALSCFPVDPPPFCDDPCFSTFRSSI